jgi:hypothetical protein
MKRWLKTIALAFGIIAIASVLFIGFFGPCPFFR